MPRGRSFFVSLAERALRALIAGLGGAVHETAEVVLPRFARRSRLYEATAKNLLRIAIELVGSVEREAPAGEPEADELLKRKTAGNVVEFGSIAAFGFSPLWLLAAASDISHGSRVYLESLVTELKRAGVLAEDAERRHRRRRAQRARGRVRNERQARRPAATRAGGAAHLARGAALERGRAALAAGAGQALRRVSG